MCGKVPPRGVGFSPVFGTYGDTRSSEVGLLRESECTWCGRKYGVVVSYIIGEERDTIWRQMAEQGDTLWDSLKKERKLLRTEITQLRDIILVWEGTAEKRELQEAVCSVKEGVGPAAQGVVEETSGRSWGGAGGAEGGDAAGA